jgi:hypothetical protein
MAFNGDSVHGNRHAELLGRRGQHLYLAIELRHPRGTIAGG